MQDGKASDTKNLKVNVLNNHITISVFRIKKSCTVHILIVKLIVFFGCSFLFVEYAENKTAYGGYYFRIAGDICFEPIEQ